MSNRSLSSTMIVRTIVATLITTLVAAVFTWGGYVSAQGHKHETRISVLEDHQKGIDTKLQRIENKLDAALRRR